jgi:TrmH family RNA methyltransferase
MDPLITSLQNPHLKTLLKLRKRTERDICHSFVIEGYRPLARAIDRRVPLTTVYYSPEWFLGANEMHLVSLARTMGTKCIRLGREAFAKVAYRDRPEGLLAVAPQWHTQLEEIPLSRQPFLLIVEHIEKPGNLGTILRSADAAGVDGVIMCDPVTDLFNPNVVRSSTGTLFTVPVAVTSSEEALEYLHTHKIKSIATTPAASTPYTQPDLKESLALVMGSEQFGLSEFWLKAADQCVCIPMHGQADSLNVAMATLITLFEAVRQRTGDLA